MGRRHRDKHKKPLQSLEQFVLAQSKANTDQAVEQLPFAEQLLFELNNLKVWLVALVIIALGFATHLTGINGAFIGDDNGQIVNNPVTQSITNFPLFFKGSTFYNGQGLAPLSGSYYRPLMTTVYSVIYSLFGALPVDFHRVQLALVISSAILLFLIFKRLFNSVVLALVLALVFLLHPIDSQAIYAIPAMQDALFVFFGVLAFWLLLRFNSVRSLLLVAACLFLSMLSKEMGLMFVVLTLIYLFLFDRKRLYPFIGIMVLPVAGYLMLKVHAVGLHAPSRIAPIDRLNLVGRLLTMPSIVLFYILKFVFPWSLASGYYWVYPNFSILHVLLPLMIDLAVLAIVVYLSVMIYHRVPKPLFYSYLFFAIWAILGILPYLQIIPLDMTACETWFYLSMIGVLGMLGVAFLAFHDQIQPNWFLIGCVLVLSLLGIRTVFRGYNWSDSYVLAQNDIASSHEDYNAYNILSEDAFAFGNFSKAKAYAEKSVKIYPTSNNYIELGESLLGMGNYPESFRAYNSALSYGTGYNVFERIGELTMVYGNPALDKQYLMTGLKRYPQDASLWMYLAILEEGNHDHAGAKVAISKAAAYGQVQQQVYDGIMNNKPYIIGLSTGAIVRLR